MMTINAKPIILWDNLLARESAILSATSSDPDHPVQYLADWREYLFWRAGSSAMTSIEVDLGSAQSAKALALYHHNFYSAGILSATLSGSDNGTDFSEVLSFQIEREAPVLKIFNEVSYRYFRLTFGAGSTPAEIGIFFLGGYLQFPSWLSAGFDPNQAEAVIEGSRSEEGFLLGNIVKHQRRRLELIFSHLSDSWLRSDFIPFWDSHIPKPFLFAWDYLNHPAEVYLVSVSEPRRELPYNPVFRSLRLDLEGRV